MSAGTVPGTIELSDVQLISLGQACRKLPRNRRRQRCGAGVFFGVKIKGRKIKLRCVRVGGKWYTTDAAFSEFLREQTDAALAVDTPDRPANGHKKPSGDWGPLG